MKKIDRFILTSFIGPFFMILLVVIFILMMQFLWVYIDELVGKGLSRSSSSGEAAPCCRWRCRWPHCSPR